MNGKLTFIFRYLWSVWFLALLSGQALGQVLIEKPVDLLALYQDSALSMHFAPQPTSGTAQDLLDGNLSTMVIIQNADTFQITMQFEDPFQMYYSKLYFLSVGVWQLEGAMNLQDLNSQSGSYQLLAAQMPCQPFTWDSVSYNPTRVQVLRLTVVNIFSQQFVLSELGLGESVRIQSLAILPYPPMVLPGTTLQLRVKMLDSLQQVYPYTLDEPLVWSSSDPAIATVDGSGRLTGVALGNCLVQVSTETGSLTGSATVSVQNSITVPRAPTKTVKVALVLQDPITDNGQKLHQRFNWINPHYLVSVIREDFNQVSGGVIQFQIVETHDDTVLFTRMYGNFLTVDSLVAYYSTPGWQPLVTAHQQGQLEFDYLAMLNYYQLCEKRNQGLIDEVWVYAHPYAGMYESRLTGPNAFWYNSPPLAGSTCQKLLSIMGLNYERGVAEALHSFGHRMESAMAQAYGRWNPQATDPNAWELFTRIDIDHPGQAHCGNVHFPPNGQSDYDYANPRYVTSYAKNWFRWPYLLDQTESINCTAWNCDHREYMKWWYRHMPRYQGVTEGILNNWWHYMVDYEEAVQLAATTPIIVGLPESNAPAVPGSFRLKANYPNPFNPQTWIEFDLPEAALVELTVYNLLGQQVRRLAAGTFPAGTHRLLWDGRNAEGESVASGVYFYQIRVWKPSGQLRWTASRKMILMR